MKTVYSRLLLFALFLTFDLIMFGAFVRITDAGLGCPDWPGCYGKATPLGALDAIRAEAAVRPDGPVTVFKAWVEMLHRYIAAGLGLIVIGLAVAATRARRDSAVKRPPGVWLAWFTLAWIILQGAFGALTVTLKLQPAIVTAHLLGGMVLFGLLVAQWSRIAGPTVMQDAQPLRRLAWAALAVLFVQIALGGWVSTNYATLACQSFPSCQGQWWPPMDFARGFELWRPLGVSADGQALPFQALTAIHMVHRLWAGLAFLMIGWLAVRALSTPAVRLYGQLLVALLVLQALTGLTNVFLDWPLVAAVAHTGGAAGLLGVGLVVAFASAVPSPARPAESRFGHTPQPDAPPRQAASTLRA